eukprot:m.39024 g.39024  ORF g.39024 m.39024 type:complete len:196 (-) comp10078_c0_seq2:420-1007(-)
MSKIIEKHEAFVFDCDGVLWCGNAIVPGAERTLQLLQRLGKKLIFVTNTSTKTRAQYVAKVEKLGITLQLDQMYTAAYAAALRLKEYPNIKRVFAVGTSGLFEELENAGYEVIRGDSVPPLTCEDDFRKMQAPVVQAVVCGFDYGVSFTKISFASLCLQKNPGCVFIGTSRDTFDQLEDRRIPGMTGLCSLSIST